MAKKGAKKGGKGGKKKAQSVFKSYPCAPWVIGARGFWKGKPWIQV